MQIHRMLQLLTTRVFLHSTYRHLVRVQYCLDNMMMASSAQLPMIFSPLTVLQDASNRVGLGLLTDAVVFSCVFQIFFHPMLRLNLISEEDHCKIFGNIQTILTLHEGTCTRILYTTTVNNILWF